jgi:lysophospholipase L1-like esterase
MFKRIVHVGDSLTAGVFNTTYPNTNGTTIRDYSRPAMMEKYLGNTNVNLGIGGATVSSEDSYNWLSVINNSPDMKSEWENFGDCYIIALGTNDITKLGSFTGNVSTDIDLNNYDNNAQTSVGCYAKIIQIIKQNQSGVKIFCVTIPKSRNTIESRAVANTKIKAIAELLDCYVIDLETYAEQDNVFAETYKNGSHNNVLGYNLRARQYISYIDWIIENNLNDFRNVQFIGTNYSYSDD